MHCIISSFQCINELEWPKQAFHTNVYHQWWLVCTCPRWFWSKCSDWQTFRQYLMHLMYHLMKYQTDFCSSWWTFWWSCMNNQSLISWWWCFRGVPWECAQSNFASNFFNLNKLLESYLKVTFFSRAWQLTCWASAKCKFFLLQLKLIFKVFHKFLSLYKLVY